MAKQNGRGNCKTLILTAILAWGFLMPALGQPSGKLISLDVRDVDIRKVLMGIADQAKINILLASKIQGTLTCRVTDVDPRELIDIIARTNGYTIEEHGRILLILNESTSGNRLHFEIIPLQNAKAADVAKIIQTLKLNKKAQVTHDERTNRLIVVYEE